MLVFSNKSKMDYWMDSKNMGFSNPDQSDPDETIFEQLDPVDYKKMIAIFYSLPRCVQ